MKRETAQRHTLKVIAIFFAISLWFYVLNSEPVQIERRLPINFILPKGYVISSMAEKEVILKIKGSKAFINNIFSNKEKYNVDLNPYFTSAGKKFKVKFYTNDINVPFGIDVIDISPKETAIELDRLVQMEIPIKVNYIGDLPKGRRVKDIQLRPKNLIVSGPIDVIKTYSNLESSPVNVGIMNKDEGEIEVSLADIDNRLAIENLTKIKLFYRTQLFKVDHAQKK